MTVTPGTTYQTMDGFGAADTWAQPLTGPQVTAFFDPVNGIGLSLLRIGIDVDGTPLGSGAYPDAIAAHAFGVKVWGAPWSPPATDKSNNSTINGGTLLTTAYQSWATTLAGFASTFQQTTGFPLYAISAQNEPDFTAPYASCLYSAPQMVSFVKVLGPMLANLNPPVKLIAAESDTWGHLWGGVSRSGVPYAYGTAILGDPEASQDVGILATHDYGLPNPLLPTRPTPPSGLQQPLWETEASDQNNMSNPDVDIAHGVEVAVWIYAAVATGGASAWHYWWLINANADGEGLLENSGDLTNPPKRFFTMGNFSKFVRPGYVRVDATGTLPSTTWVVAFQNPSDETLIVVAINSGTNAVPLTATIAGGNGPSQVTPWVTSDAENLAAHAPIPVTGGAFSTTLGAQSVTTFVGAP